MVVIRSAGIFLGTDVGGPHVEPGAGLVPETGFQTGFQIGFETRFQSFFTRIVDHLDEEVAVPHFLWTASLAPRIDSNSH